MKLTVLALCLVTGAARAASLSPAQVARIDAAANQALQLTGVPGASIAVVRDGKTVLLRAYGYARLQPPEPMSASMAFPIGSVSKQFTASMVMLLCQDGTLNLDDTVGKYLPELTLAHVVTIREILSHTAGYSDFWPEDYAPLAFQRPITTQKLVDVWATKNLDFAPGTAWQYSNTGYAIAALIVQKAGGAPFYDQVKQRILDPLGMAHSFDYNASGVPPGGPTGYERYAFATPRPAPLDQPGWSLGSYGLAMTADDLARWDISLMNRSVLAPASYAVLESEVKLKNGQGTGYGLGVDVSTIGGHRVIEHSGEATGFVTENVVYPDDHDAVVVLTNQDASRAAGVIARQVAPIAFGIPAVAPENSHIATVLAMLADLARGQVDAARLNANALSYFTPQVVADYKNSLVLLGPPLAARDRVHEDRGGMVFHAYEITYPGRTVTVTTYELPDGRLDQFLIVP